MDNTQSNEIQSTKHAAVWYNAQGEAFFPYQQYMFDTKTEAKAHARQNQDDVSRFSDLRFSGRTIALDGKTKYPLVMIPGPTKDSQVHLCLCGGEAYKAMVMELIVNDALAKLAIQTGGENEEPYDKGAAHNGGETL